MPFENLLVYQCNNFACIRVASSLIQDMKILIFKTYFNDESYLWGDAVKLKLKFPSKLCQVISSQLK